MTNDDLYREEDGGVEDVESGFDEVGTLKLSRLVATSSGNPKPEASSALPSPPERCGVPNMCAICLDAYQPGQVVAWSAGCRHAFHQDCISHYLAKTMIEGETPCPSCRQKFCALPGEKLTSASSICNNHVTSTQSIEAGEPSV